MKKTKVILSLFLLLAAIKGQAQQRHELTVKEAVDLAFKNVAEIKNARIDYQVQEAKNKEIFGQALPQISGSVQANHYISLPRFLFPDATSTAVYSILKEEGVNGSNGPITKVPDPIVRQLSFQQPWNLAAGASVTQLLFQPDVFVGLKARQSALDYSSALVEQTAEKIKDSAYKRYYAILIAEKQLHFLGESVKRLEKLYHDDSIMYENGFAERLDMDKVMVQLNNLRTTRSVVENSVQLAYAALKFAIGVPQTDTVVLKETLTTESIKEGILAEGFRYEDRPEIRTLNHVRKLQELDLKRNRLGYIPTLSAIGNYAVNGQGQTFFTSANTTYINSSFIGLNVSIPLFDGFQRKYKIKQSQLTLQKVDNTIENVRDAIDFEQVATKASLTNALNNLDAQESNQQLAERVYQTTKKKFEQGLGSSFEVLQADADYQTAQANYFNALYQATVARISYQRALGRLQ